MGNLYMIKVEKERYKSDIHSAIAHISGPN